MTERELALLQAVKSAVKNNPSFFSAVVVSMNDGVNEAIKEANNYAMNMEKLAFAFHASVSNRHTAH